MQLLTYFIFRFFVLLFSVLPFRIIYIISDGFRFLLHRVLKYRREVIQSNLERSFPEKDEAEIQRLIKGAYANLCDIMVEGIKGLNMSDAQCLKRYKFLNPEVANKLFERNTSIFILSSHYGNWEWGPLGVSLQIKHHTVGIFAPIKNKYIDHYIQNARCLENVSVHPMKTTFQAFDRFKDRLTAFTFIMDQSPSNPQKAHWVKFLNQDTAVLHGADNHARRTGLPVVFFEKFRIKRGHYEIIMTLLFDDPTQAKEGEISRAYMEQMEEIIRKKPEDWLWSHRRWKHGWKEGYKWVGSERLTIND